MDRNFVFPQRNLSSYQRRFLNDNVFLSSKAEAPVEILLSILLRTLINSSGEEGESATKTFII